MHSFFGCFPAFPLYLLDRILSSVLETIQFSGFPLDISWKLLYFHFGNVTIRRWFSVVFFTTISKITKEIFVKICWQLKTPTWTWKCTRCIMPTSYLYASDFPFKKLLQTRSTCRNNMQKNVWKKSNEWRVLVDKSTDHDKQHFDLFLAELRRSTIIVGTEPHVCIKIGTHATLFYGQHG